MKKRLDLLIDHQRVINDEIERNTILGNRVYPIVFNMTFSFSRCSIVNEIR